MLMQSMIWACLALAGGVAGWCACAWAQRQRIQALQVQLKVLRQTLDAHSDQARRQISQLQAALAQRPPAPAPEPAVDDSAGARTPLAEGIRRRPSAPDRFVRMDDGFPATAIVGDDGFAPTQVGR